MDDDANESAQNQKIFIFLYNEVSSWISRFKLENFLASKWIWRNGQLSCQKWMEAKFD